MLLGLLVMSHGRPTLNHTLILSSFFILMKPYFRKVTSPFIIRLKTRD